MAKRKKKRIASRGSVNNIILKTLVNGDKYGYEIIKEVEDYSEGKIKLKQPSLYSSLSRFEEKGFVTSYWGDSDIGGRRHYYHLTDKGKKYYNVSVLKMDDDSDEIDEDIEPITNVDIVEKTEDTIIMSEVPDSEIPAIVDFQPKETPEIIPDHNFYKTTQMNEIKQDVATSESTNQDKQQLWSNLVVRVKDNNRNCANSSYKKLHYIQPKKSKKVVLDTDGIYKLRDEDYTPTPHKPIKSKIVDNVGKRIMNPIDYDPIYAPQQKPNKPIEISEEEKLRKNQLFLEKFNMISESKLKPTTPPPAPIQTKPIADKEETIDYRSKLDKLINNFAEPTPTIHQEPKIEENNIFNYLDEDEERITQNSYQSEEEDKFIDFDSEDFEVKTDDKQYVEEISNYSATQETIKINRYENKANLYSQDNNTYVLINKVKCLFGFIMVALFAIELIASYFIFKNNNLLQQSDNKLYIWSAIICAIISLAYILPVVFNSQNHKLNNFKLRYVWVLGILTFLVSLILIYCINALIGFEIDNFSYFAVKIILPTILTFNFVIAPPIYAAIINSKRFYD